MAPSRRHLARPLCFRPARPAVSSAPSTRMRWLSWLAGVLWVLGSYFYYNYEMYQCLWANVEVGLSYEHTRGLHTNYTVDALVESSIVTRFVVLQHMSDEEVTGLYYQTYWTVVSLDKFHTQMCYQARNRPDIAELRDTSIHRKRLYLDLAFDIEKEIKRRKASIE